jgi:hypothetical protein
MLAPESMNPDPKHFFDLSFEQCCVFVFGLVAESRSNEKRLEAIGEKIDYLLNLHKNFPSFTETISGS